MHAKENAEKNYGTAEIRMVIFAVSGEIDNANMTAAAKMGRPISASPVAAATFQG